MTPAAAATTQINTADSELRARLAVEAPEGIDWINMLIYGDPGVGKTYLLGTALESTDTSPILVLDVDGGLITIRGKKVDKKKIRTLDDLNNVYNTLFASIKNDKLYYKTIAIDSLTELAALDMKIIMHEAWTKNPEKVIKEVPSPREWGICREHIRTIVRAFRDLPCNVVYTAHSTEDKQEGRPSKFEPAFAGKLKVDVPGFMDIVGYLTTKNDQGLITRQMQLLGTNRVVAKDRTRTLGDMLENPTLPMIWELMNANGNTDKV